jgi:hypothetical protein
LPNADHGERAQVVVDDGLAGQRDDAAVGQHRIGLGAIGHAAVLEFAVLVGLQQVGGTGQGGNAEVLEVRGVRRTAGPQGVGAGVFFVGAAQALVGDVGEQAGEVAGSHHATSAELQHAAGQLHAVQAAGLLTV